MKMAESEWLRINKVEGRHVGPMFFPKSLSGVSQWSLHRIRFTINSLGYVIASSKLEELLNSANDRGKVGSIEVNTGVRLFNPRLTKTCAALFD